MKKILFILTLLFSLSASAQVDTTKQIQTISAHGYAYKHLQAVYALLFPTDTLQMKSDWRAIAFKDTLPYFWTGRAWRQFGTGSSGPTDTSTFIVDTTFSPIAKVIGTDSVRLKSMRIQVNGTPVDPAETDSTVDFDLTVETDPADLSGIRDTLGKKVDTSNVVQIDTTSRPNGYIVYWDSTARKYKHKADSVGTGGGSSGSGAFSKLEWFSVDENAPAVGDSVMVHDSFSGKYLDVYRNGIKQPHVVEDTGWARVNDTTISVLPPFAANEFWHIEARDSSAYTQLTLQGLPPPGATWTDLTFTTTNGWFTNTAGVWSSGAGAFGGYGLESGSFTGEVWVKQQRADASAALGILGFNESNTNEGNAGYEFSSYFDQTGAITYLDNGSGTTVGYTLATGSWMALHRAASGTVTIETSADGLTGWTVRYTFTPTSTATFYINMNVHSATYKCHYPQVYY